MQSCGNEYKKGRPIMIKIKSDKIEAAKEMHWRWLKRRFNIIEDDFDKKEDHRGCLSKSEKMKLFELLKITGTEKEKIESLKKLICVEPKNLRAMRDNPSFSHLVKDESQEYIDWKNNTKKSDEEKALAGTIYKDYIQKEQDRDDVIRLLGYNSLESKETKWNAFTMCEMLNISICPYCNRQYIYTAKKENEEWVARPQLDHFYIKSKYPFLSCSFFNLIPSCGLCNGGKNDKEKETVYPYLEDFNDDNGKKKAAFKVDAAQLDEVIRLGTVDPDCKYTIKLDIIDDEDEHIAGSNDVFNLTNLYQLHQLELKDLISRYLSIDGSELDNLAMVLLGKKTESVNNNDRMFAKRIVLGLPLNMKKDEVYLLKKFKEDVIDQLEET